MIALLSPTLLPPANCNPGTRLLIAQAAKAAKPKKPKKPKKSKESRVNTQLIGIKPSKKYILSLYLMTEDKSMNPGSGLVEVGLFDKFRKKIHQYDSLADLHSPDGSVTKSWTSTDLHGWKRIYWWFETAPKTAYLSIRLGVASGTAYFDGVQLEEALDGKKPEPTTYSPHSVNLIHPFKDITKDLSGEELRKK
jgi:hypothetical protein